MINHARTLLANRPVNFFSVESAYSFLVDPEFRPVKLPSALGTVHRALFGARPEQLYLEIVSCFYMRLVGQVPYASMLLEALDTRTTFETNGPETYAEPEGFSVLPSSPLSNVPEPIVYGEQETDAVNGRARWSWSLLRSGSDLTVQPMIDGIPSATTALEFTNSLSNAVPLLGSALYIKVPETAVNWAVAYVAQPRLDVDWTLSKLETLSQEAVIELFALNQPAAAAPRLRELYDVCTSKSRLPGVDRLAAYLVAFVLRVELMRA